jgi:hypothetical protein
MLRNVKHKVRLLAIATMLASGSASASVDCQGKVTYLGLNPDGTVNVNIGFGIWGMCNVSSTYSLGSVTFTPESCRAWYSTFLAAQKSGSTIRMHFISGPACAQIGHWVFPDPAPYHMVSVD